MGFEEAAEYTETMEDSGQDVSSFDRQQQDLPVS